MHKTSQNPYRTSRPALFSADCSHKGNISGTTDWLNSVSIASITYQECIQCLCVYILIWYILLLYTITIDIRYSHYNLFYLCFQRQNIRSHPRKNLFFGPGNRYHRVLFNPTQSKLKTSRTIRQPFGGVSEVTSVGIPTFSPSVLSMVVG